MFLIVSRFTVVSDNVDEVCKAFRTRPRLVDAFPGFLGMEVFRDVKDPATFHLLTRWTDLDSYRNWHQSEAHGESMRTLPRGLKLAPGSRQISELERLPLESPGSLLEYAGEALPLLGRFLASSARVCFLEATLQGDILQANSALADALHVPLANLPGRKVWDFLAEHEVPALRQRIERRAGGSERFRLHFVNAQHSPFTLSCLCEVLPSYFLILGEPESDSEATSQENWLALNNELAVLGRENARRARELEESRNQLERTLADLRDSHWLLRKIQEVLPICMECGKVKSGDRWENVVQYLKDNALFLSHGYCPDCVEKLRAAWGLGPEAP